MALIDFPIKNRWTGEVQFTAKIEAAEDTPLGVKIGLAVKWAIGAGANLAGANLAGAYLAGANLADAYLADAYLAGANLADAYLAGAYLAGANLAGANLAGANLAGAYLAGANLADAYLADAYLAGANLADAYLAGANLADAYLAGAKIPEAALRPIKADMWMTLTESGDPNEVRFLIAALRHGAVDGSTYGEGKECACLVGTLSRFKSVAGEDRDHDASRPAERWFMAIRPGDVPGKTGEDGKETSGGFAARKALEWAEQWCAALGIDPEFPPAPDLAIPAIDPRAAPEAA